MTNSISTRLIIFTLSALLAFAVAEREFNLCAREEKVNNQLPKSCLSNLAEESALIKRSIQRLSKEVIIDYPKEVIKHYPKDLIKDYLLQKMKMFRFALEE